MLRVTQRLLAPIAKKTTGIVGVPVVPNAREVLISLYDKTLQEVKAIPEGNAYRKMVEGFTQYRKEIVQKNEDIFAIESAIGAGQVEELIRAAESELGLIPKYVSWRPWERKPASPDSPTFSRIYDEMESIDPESVAYIGLKDLALKRQAEAAARRSQAAAAMAKAAPAPAPAPAPAAGTKA